jgi:hypothetical protein
LFYPFFTSLLKRPPGQGYKVAFSLVATFFDFAVSFTFFFNGFTFSVSTLAPLG